MKSTTVNVIVMSMMAFWMLAGCKRDSNAVDAQTNGHLVNTQDIRSSFTNMADKGRNLYLVIIRANTEREFSGFSTVLPQTGKNLSNDKKDIGSIAFKDARQYFNCLFDLPTVKAPYVTGDSSLALANGNKDVLWNVMLDYDEKTISEQAPLFISANFDCSKLPAQWPSSDCNADKVIPIGSCPIIGTNGIVIVLKCGKVIALPADKVTLRNIYGNIRLKLPQQYLTPTSIATVGK